MLARYTGVYFCKCYCVLLLIVLVFLHVLFSCVVEDDKVGTDLLEEHITAFEDLVQSVDVAAFNKI